MRVDRSEAETFSTWFRALADPSRILILNYIATSEEPCSVGDIAAAVGLSQPTVSHHLKALSEVRFVLMSQDKNTHFFRVNEACLAEFPDAAELILGRLQAVPPADTSGSKGAKSA